MERTHIPGLDRSVSRIGLGTWAIGGWMWGGTDAEASVRTIRTALDDGIDLIDTAPVYGQGRSEELVGRALAESGKRADATLVTKVGLNWQAGEAKPFRDCRPERIRQEVADSLRRLQTDYIDVYMVHWPDPMAPIDETARTLEELRTSGKVRALAVSNYSVEQMDAFRAAAPLHVLEPPYNMFERGIEGDLLPYCREAGIGTLVYGPLCRGLLTGKMRRDTTFEGDDLRQVDPKFQSPRYEQYLDAVSKLDRFARDGYGKHVIHLAVRWVLDQPGVSVALWGARRPDQLAPVREAMGWGLDDDALDQIDRILQDTVRDPVGPEFMAPPARDKLAA